MPMISLYQFLLLAPSLSFINFAYGQGQCGTGSSPTSDCRVAFVNSLTDFCLYAPPEPGPQSTIGNTERIEVAWCMRTGTGARLIPNGTITGAHFVQTPDFVQITGIGQLTMLNIPSGDEGGELDPHGADGNGNPIGALVFSSAFGQVEQIQEWTNFMSDSEFCFRACKPGPNAATFCQHIYDVMGCQWNMPGDYSASFTHCDADSGEPMGVYGTSTFFQGQPSTPAAHPAPSSSQCTAIPTIGNGLAVSQTIPPIPIPSSSSTSSSSGTTTSTSPVSGSGTSSPTAAPSSSQTSSTPGNSSPLSASPSATSSIPSTTGSITTPSSPPPTAAPSSETSSSSTSAAPTTSSSTSPSSAFAAPLSPDSLSVGIVSIISLILCTNYLL